MPPPLLSVKKPKKKATPKWKLYLPKDITIMSHILIRKTNGLIDYAENLEQAKRVLLRAEERYANTKRQWDAPTVWQQKLFNFEDHMEEVPIKLGRNFSSRHGVNEIEITSQSGFKCMIGLTDLLDAIKRTLVTEGLIFGTWGIKNIGGSPRVYLIGGISNSLKE